jgi:hypothetical protein
MATNDDPKWMLWTGRVLSGLSGGLLVLSGVFKLLATPEVAQNFAKFGYPAGALRGIGALELVCGLVFLIPRTSVLGAILVAAYLGGAVATHVRIGEAPVGLAPALLAVFAWAGLYLRDPRLRALLPLRRPPAG